MAEAAALQGRINDIQERLRTSEETRHTAFRLDDAAGWVARAGDALGETASDLARTRVAPDPKLCDVPWGVCLEHGNTLRGTGGRAGAPTRRAPGPGTTTGSATPAESPSRTWSPTPRAGRCGPATATPWTWASVSTEPPSPCCPPTPAAPRKEGRGHHRLRRAPEGAEHASAVPPKDHLRGGPGAGGRAARRGRLGETGTVLEFHPDVALPTLSSLPVQADG